MGEDMIYQQTVVVVYICRDFIWGPIFESSSDDLRVRKMTKLMKILGTHKNRALGLLVDQPFCSGSKHR